MNHSGLPGWGRGRKTSRTIGGPVTYRVLACRQSRCRSPHCLTAAVCIHHGLEKAAIRPPLAASAMFVAPTANYRRRRRSGARQHSYQTDDDNHCRGMLGHASHLILIARHLPVSVRTAPHARRARSSVDHVTVLENRSPVVEHSTVPFR